MLLRGGVISLLSLITVSSYASCVGINCNCTVAASNMNFGSYSTTNASATTVNGNVQVTCSALVAGLNVSYTIAMNAGNSANFTPRSMTYSTYNLNYNLFSDASYSTIWGDGTSGTSLVSDSYFLNLISVTRNYTVYGKIPALQNIAPGSYSDSILVTITF